LLLTIVFRTVLAVLLLVGAAVAVLRVRDRGEQMDRFEYAKAGGRLVWVHSNRGWLTLVVASPWPESRGVRWVSGTDDDDPIGDHYGIVMIRREQLWGDR
jgi:hypothetical protein